MENKTETAAEVNRLYWDTDASVAEISSQLNVSRRAMYDAIEPFPSGVECASCGAELFYSNRSARAAGIARCLVCGNERGLDPDISADDVGVIPPFEAGLPAARPKMQVARDQRVAMIAGFAIAGLLVGVVATWLLRRKR